MTNTKLILYGFAFIAIIIAMLSAMIRYFLYLRFKKRNSKPVQHRWFRKYADFQIFGASEKRVRFMTVNNYLLIVMWAALIVAVICFGFGLFEMDSPY